MGKYNGSNPDEDMTDEELETLVKNILNRPEHASPEEVVPLVDVSPTPNQNTLFAR